MKTKLCVLGFLMFFLCAGFQLCAGESFEAIKTKAENGDALSQNVLGAHYATGNDVAKDEAEAARWYQKSAVQGYAIAQFNLGFMYEKGLGVKKDYAEAVKWYRKAADQGNCDAQNNIGNLYLDGTGVPTNFDEAIKWYRKAAEQGDPTGQNNLGYIYANGKGVPQDYTESVNWYRKAADQGMINAQYNLGFMYNHGQGVQQNFSESAMWYRKAAEQGDAGAQLKIGLMYEAGEGVQKDLALAAKWYQKAADQGDMYAQYDLAKCYYNGRGVLVDYAVAVKWNALSAAQGYEEAVNVWNYIYKKEIPSDQITEGQRMAREFVARKETPGLNLNSDSPVVADSPKACGTGFFITDDGYFISNHHVVKDAATVRIVTSAGTVDAKVINTDAANDLALLKAEGKFSSLPVAPSRQVSLGATVATVGFPDPGLQGFSPKLAKGEIASLSGAADDARYFQISVPVQPGNSGGALVDEHGNVVGIVSAKLNAAAALASSGALPENVNYAIKSSYLLSFLESVPGVESKLKPPLMADSKFEDVVKSAQNAAVLVLVY